uniref:Secernin 2 n=1 Tax=Eptatretus burgeri TaxID=7764 RepID=A0A8C4R929_EPTBU
MLSGTSPESCDTFVAMSPATLRGDVVFGKNSDRPADEVQEVLYIPAQNHTSGELLSCTYIDIPQASRTHAVVLSKPAWMWGAEMGANEFGVCIGNEAVWTREKLESKEALLGMDMLRLALERAESADQALEVLTSLLAKYGQGGLCVEGPDEYLIYHNSFLVVDRRRSWVLETAGAFWAAELVTEGVRNISNCLSVGTSVHREHPQLRAHARERGWWDGKSPFHFAQIYSEYGGTCPRLHAGAQLLKKHSGTGVFHAQEMMSILRDKESGICMEGGHCTTGSMVSVLNPQGAALHFLTATPNPCRSIFKPFAFTENVVPLLKTVATPMKTAALTEDKRPDRRHALYRSQECAFAGTSPAKLLQGLQELEKRGLKMLDMMASSSQSDPAGSCSLSELFSNFVEEEMNVHQTVH